MQILLIEDIRSIIENNDYKLLSSQYKNINSPLTVECPNGHKYDITWKIFSKGYGRCIYCRPKKTGRCKASIVDIKKAIEKEKYILISDDYIGNSSKLILKCPIGHLYEISWNNFQQGHRCAMCAKEEYSKSKMALWRQVLQNEKSEILSSEYVRSSEKLTIRCPQGHVYLATPSSIQQGYRCPTCPHSYSRSSAEKEIRNIYCNLQITINNRSVIAPKEIDLYFPDQKVAVEYCGVYWHSEYALGDQIIPSYHRDKLDRCIDQEIRLLTIFDDEWKEHKDICISRINASLGIVQNKIYARKCEAKEISNIDAYEFLKRTHLQGAGKCKIAYGLFHENKLVQVMTFGSPTRAHTSKGKRVLEMKRLAGELNTIVVGGAGKLFKIGLKYAQNENYEIIKSYCDLRWDTGNLYQKLGFIKVDEVRYICQYTNGCIRFKNQKLAYNKSRTGKTKVMTTQQKRLYKIYDCGKQVWEYELTK